METPCSIPNQEAKHIVADDTLPYWDAGKVSHCGLCFYAIYYLLQYLFLNNLSSKIEFKMLFICLFTLFFYFLYVFIWMMVVWGLNFITIKIYDVNKLLLVM